MLVREHAGVVHEVMVVPGGFHWNGQTYLSLSAIAQAITGTNWNGPRFFGVGKGRGREQAATTAMSPPRQPQSPPQSSADRCGPMRKFAICSRAGDPAMKPTLPKPKRCAIYTRKSTEHNLDLAFNSLDAQREACEAYIKSQAHEGWRLVPEHYDDGGLSGASLDRPALQGLLAQVRPARST